jgi:N6-L-threonylcarbamoyladenine synthase
MRILAIETSCDETGIAVVDVLGVLPNVSFAVLGNALQSQIDVHKEYGGVFPAVAKREHSRNFVPVLKKALGQSCGNSKSEILNSKKISNAKSQEIKTILEREPELLAQLIPFLETHENPDIDAIAVTVGPGLEPALWVGINAARALAVAWGVPIVPVNHMEGHLIAALVERDENSKFKISNFKFPAVALLVSGGHTELLLMRDWFIYERLGETRDDAAGEAFDKSARMMGLSYPGGPEISKLAQQAREENVAQPYTLPRPMLHSNDFDFSYSGLKNAVRLLLENTGQPTPQQQKQIAREVEDAIVETLVAKARRAVVDRAAHTLVVSGGVSANTYLKQHLETMATAEDIALAISKPELATDNGLMIALAGALRFAKKEIAEPSTLRAQGNLTLGTKIVF